MKNYVFGIIFLISNIAWSMELTEPRKSNTLHVTYLNSQCFFSVVRFFSSDGKAEIVFDDDGFFTLDIALLYCEQNRVLYQIVNKALERLKKATKSKKITQKIENLASPLELSALKNFVEDHKSKFMYEIYNERDKTWHSKYFKDLQIKKTETLLSPISITLAASLDVDVNSKTSSTILSKTVAIEKSSNAPIDGGILEKIFSSVSEPGLTSSSSEYDGILCALRSIETAFPIFKNIRLWTALGKSSAGIVMLPEQKVEDIAKLTPEDAVSNLINFVDQKDETSKLGGIMPLYFIYFVKWGGGFAGAGDYRFWIFEANQIESNTFCVTLKHRFGNDPESEVLERMFPHGDLLFSEIYSL